MEHWLIPALLNSHIFFLTFPSKLKVFAMDAVILCILLLCRRLKQSERKLEECKAALSRALGDLQQMKLVGHLHDGKQVHLYKRMHTG